MNTRVRLVGGNYSEEGTVMWGGDLPLLPGAPQGMNVLVEEKPYRVTEVCLALGRDGHYYQIVFVLPK